MIYRLLFCALSILGVVLSKSWQETLPIFLNQHLANSGFSDSLITNSAFGLTIGAIFAGIVTNILGPYIALPLNLSILGLSSAAILGLSSSSLVHNIQESLTISTTLIILALRVLMIIRGVLIAMSMNAGYALLTATYGHEEKALGRATSILYIVLSLSLGGVTFLAKDSKLFFKLLVFICMLAAALLIFLRSNSNSHNDIKNDVKKRRNILAELRIYGNSFVHLLQDQKFVLACLVSMLCVGGFLNCIYILRKIKFEGLAMLQSQGRIIGLFGMLSLSNAYQVIERMFKTSYGDFVSMLMPWLTGIPAICMFIMMYGIRFESTIMIKIGFLSCMAIASASQPLAKWYILSIANNKSKELKTNIVGSAQALVTLLNSFFEFAGSALIFSFALGGTIYIYAAIAVYILVSRNFIIANQNTLNNSYTSINK